MNLKNMRKEILKLSSFKPMLFFFGAYIFSNCFYYFIHEIGHAIMFLILGYSDVEIHISPFSGYVTVPFFSFYPDLNVFLVFLGGPLFDLLCATIIIILFWRIRNPYLLPLLMYSSTAFLSEGIVILNCFFNSSETMYDFDWLMFLGLSPIIVAIICGVVLFIGLVITYLIWPIVEISPSDSILRKLFINSGFIIYLILTIIFRPFFVPIGAKTQFYLIFIYLSSISFFILSIAIYKPVFPFIDRLTHTDVIEVSWHNVQYSLGLGVGIFIFLLFFFN